MLQLMTAAALVAALLCASTPVSAADGTVATVGSQTITQAQLEKHVRPKLIEIEQQRYEAMREGLEELIGESLLAQEAKVQGMTTEALVKQEIDAKAAAPTEDEIKELYEGNKEQLENAPLDAVKPRLVEYLKSVKAAERRQAYLKTLKDKYKTTVALQAPVVQVGTGGRPSRGGGTNAPVKIIEFSDYECPYCQRAESVVDEVLKHYGDKIQVTYRDFPLAFHANARQASLAAHCAQAQGKFWEYHDKLFIRRELEAAKLKTLAGELGLDQGKFDACLDKEEFKAALEKDMAEGADAGVTGTPTFFVNGRVMSGAQPFEELKRVIDEELARGKAGKS